jgi:hypothetical protein
VTSIDPAQCPLCAQPNDCALVAGHTKCWCFETPVPQPVLARVPTEAQGVACVCRRCANGSTDSEARRRLAMRWTRR